jgi:hypothetical protein
VNRGLSPPHKGFSQRFIEHAALLFTFRLLTLSRLRTASFEFETFA